VHLAHSFFLLRSDISPSNIVHFGGRGILVDYHAAKMINTVDGTCGLCQSVTGKVVYIARSLHYAGGQQSSETDMESLFYSLLDVASGGHALPWRNYNDVVEVRMFKFAVLENDKDWAEARKQCREPLVPLLDRLRGLIRQPNSTLDMYLLAFDVEKS
jgi:hypothetical protein